MPWQKSLSTRLVVKRHKIYLYINPFQKTRESRSPQYRATHGAGRRVGTGTVLISSQALEIVDEYSSVVQYIQAYSTGNNGQNRMHRLT